MPRPLPTGSLAGMLAVCLLASCSLRLPVESRDIPTPVKTPVGTTATGEANGQTAEPDVLVWLIANRYHTGLVLPYDWLVESGFIAPDGFHSPKSVVMSWGNRDAYSDAGMDSNWKILRVLLTPTPSVTELIAADWNVAEMIPHQRIWRKLVPRDRGPALAEFLNQCSTMDPDGRPVVVCPSSWGEGVQLESRHSYFVPRVCNVWTAQAMEQLGCEINPWRALFAGSLAKQAEANGFELIWDGYGEQIEP